MVLGRRTPVALLAMVLVIVCGLLPRSAQAGPNANAKVLIHLATTTTKGGCTRSQATPSCANVVTAGDLYPGSAYFAYVLVADADSAAGIAGVELGIGYNGAETQGVDVWEWTRCADLEFSTSSWPASGSGALVTWNRDTNCQRSQPGGAGTGVVTCAGYFYCGAYSADTLCITTHPVSGNAAVTSCEPNEDVLVSTTYQPNPSPLGYAVFSQNAATPGYSPCTGGVKDPVLTDLLLTGLGPYVSRFAVSVAGVGDYNKDGFGDVLVGAPLSSPPPYNGHAYIYYGGPPLNATPDLTLAGSGTVDGFGESVASVSDVNNDGWPDILIGAATQGRAYLFLGSAAQDTVPDLTLTCPSSSGWMCVAGLGDINDDSYDDWAVTRRVNDSDSVDVYLGGSSPDNIADYTFSGGDPAYNYRCIAKTGDVNGDGYGDFLIGTAGASPNGLNRAGEATLYYGGSGTPTVGAVFVGHTAGDELGASVAGGGHVNNDVYGDVIIGAPWCTVGGYPKGRAYVFYGGAPCDTTPDLIFTGTTASRVGDGVDIAGDVNGDGFSDLLVSRQDDYSAGVNIYLGGPSADNVADRSLVGFAVTSGENIALAGAGDVNGDGYSDILIGNAHTYSSTTWGRFYVYKAYTSIASVPVDVVSRPPSTWFLSPRPNPVTDRTTLTFSLGREANVRVDLFDVAGRLIRPGIYSQRLPAGTTTWEWRPDGIGRGVYFLRARGNAGSASQKVVVTERR